MMTAITLIAGAAVFLGGFTFGVFYTPKARKVKSASSRSGSVTVNEEYHNLMNYNGEPEI